MNKAVFLDRDGVLNEPLIVDGKAFPPRSLDELVITEGAKEQMIRLRAKGFLLICITNQPDISYGLITWESLLAIKSAITVELGLDEIFVCPHGSGDVCDCRKPNDGSFRDAATKYDIDLSKSWAIGDRWVDIEAGRRAGVRTVLFRHPYSWESTSAGLPDSSLNPDFVGANLTQCVDSILQG